MKFFLLLLILCIYSGEPAFAQPYPGQIDSSSLPKLNLHYQPEYSSDIITDTAKWFQQEQGLHVSFGSITLKGDFNEEYFTSLLDRGRKILEELSEKLAGHD